MLMFRVVGWLVALQSLVFGIMLLATTDSDANGVLLLTVAAAWLVADALLAQRR